MATITFDQIGLSAGLPNAARSDGRPDGSEVTIRVSPPGGIVEFVSIPEGDNTAVSSLQQISPSAWSFNPTAAVYGTWLVQYKINASNSARRTFAVRTPGRGLRIPAFNEKSSLKATLANGAATYVAESDHNEGGTYTGWAPTLAELYRTVDGMTGLSREVQMVSGPAVSNPPVNSLVFADVTGGSVTLNLPHPHKIGDQLLVKLTGAAAHECTIHGGASDIDGDDTLVLTTSYEWAVLISNGSHWFQIS